MQKYGVFVITGGTGFVGSRLIKYLLAMNNKVYVLTRGKHASNNKHLEYINWDVEKGFIEKNIDEDNVTVVHLAGANIASKRWTENFAHELIKSRVESTQFLWQCINNGYIKAQHLIAITATGIYGNSSLDIFTEESVSANDYLAKVCIAWENAIRQGNSKGLPMCIYRLPMVVDMNGGAIKKMLITKKMGFIVLPGSGKQLTPFVHLDDVIKAIYFAMENKTNGLFNVCSGEHISLKNLIQKFITTKNIVYVPFPKLLLRLGLGSIAEELCKSTRVSNKKLLYLGFVLKNI